jgi:O-antigen/teichoic acid export membrane protein
VIEVIALLLLVPPFGVAGAGWSLVIAYGSMFALMLWREHRVFPVPYPWGRIARIPVILALALAATYLLPDSGTGALMLRIAVAAAIPLGYIAIGFLTRAELARAKAIVAGLRNRGGSAPPGDTAEPEPDERL